jgi:hypothetical protein
MGSLLSARSLGYQAWRRAVFDFAAAAKVGDQYCPSRRYAVIAGTCPQLENNF